MEWISIKDKLPANGQTIVCFNGSFYIKKYGMNDVSPIFHLGDILCYHITNEKFEMTHWMPLTEPIN